MQSPPAGLSTRTNPDTAVSTCQSATAPFVTRTLVGVLAQALITCERAYVGSSYVRAQAGANRPHLVQGAEQAEAARHKHVVERPRLEAEVEHGPDGQVHAAAREHAGRDGDGLGLEVDAVAGGAGEELEDAAREGAHADPHLEEGEPARRADVQREDLPEDALLELRRLELVPPAEHVQLLVHVLLRPAAHLAERRQALGIPLPRTAVAVGLGILDRVKHGQILLRRIYLSALSSLILDKMNLWHIFEILFCRFNHRFFC